LLVIIDLPGICEGRMAPGLAAGRIPPAQRVAAKQK